MVTESYHYLLYVAPVDTVAINILGSTGPSLAGGHISSNGRSVHLLGYSTINDMSWAALRGFRVSCCFPIAAPRLGLVGHSCAPFAGISGT